MPKALFKFWKNDDIFSAILFTPLSVGLIKRQPRLIQGRLYILITRERCRLLQMKILCHTFVAVLLFFPKTAARFSNKLPDARLSQAKKRILFSWESAFSAVACLVGLDGFEPSEWRSQSPLPYHLAIAQHIKTANRIWFAVFFMGWEMGLEPTTTRTTIWRSTTELHPP